MKVKRQMFVVLIFYKKNGSIGQIINIYHAKH